MSANNRDWLPFLAVLLLAAAGVVRADVAPPDWREQASNKVWEEKLRPEVFPGREIIEGAAQNVIELKAPYRAEDATVVPISIHTELPQSEQEYIKRIHVYIDKNPAPLVGIFEFTPASGRADLAMRVRVDDFTFIRAIAEMNNGKLYMAKSFIRATGACSAPPPKSIDDSFAHMGAMKLKTVGQLVFEKPNLLQLQIKHPNITGMQPLRIGSRVLPPAHFVNHFRVDYNGTLIMKAQLTFSISMDPSFRFFFVPESPGTITVEASDTQNNHWKASHAIGPA